MKHIIAFILVFVFICVLPNYTSCEESAYKTANTILLNLQEKIKSYEVVKDRVAINFSLYDDSDRILIEKIYYEYKTEKVPFVLSLIGVKGKKTRVVDIWRSGSMHRMYGQLLISIDMIPELIETLTKIKEDLS